MSDRVRLYVRRGTWWASWTADKKTVRHSTRAKTEVEARAVIASWGDLAGRVAVKNEKPGRVYFIAAEGLNVVKIGWTSIGGIRLRMKSLRTFCPVPIAVLGGYPGTLTDELREHRRWAADRMQGEWFRRSKTLNDYIREVSEWAPRRDPTVIHEKR